MTKENTHLASTVVSKTNPEWESKKLNYNEQPSNNGEACSIPNYMIGTQSKDDEGRKHINWDKQNVN